MNETPRDKLIKHPNNPCTPKQRAFFKRITSRDMPSRITTVLGASKAIQCVLRSVHSATPPDYVVAGTLPMEAFAVAFDVEGNVKDRGAGSIANDWAFTAYFKAWIEFKKAAGKASVKPVAVQPVQSACKYGAEFDTILEVQRQSLE